MSICLCWSNFELTDCYSCRLKMVFFFVFLRGLNQNSNSGECWTNGKQMRVHRSAAQRRLTALGSVDTQLTPPSLSRLSQQLGCWPGPASQALFFLLFFAGSTQERATTSRSRNNTTTHTHTGPCVCAHRCRERERGNPKNKK
jgi:hypothetical protein